MVSRGVPSSQQPIRSYAGHAQPVSSEVKFRRAALPVLSDLSQRSVGSCMLRGSENQVKTPEFTCEKGKTVGALTHWRSGAKVTERRRESHVG